MFGYIVLDPEEWEYLGPLIDSPEFQRLRRVLHLGTSRFTYHGAEHSRFGHCMGMMWVVLNLVRRFRGDGVDIPKEVEQDAVSAALLHDLGHGPLSHVFEQLTNHVFHHEDMTQKMIQTSPLKDKIQRPDSVATFLKGIVPAELQWVGETLSGPLDADKMDYLLRDSHYTGTDYGLYDYDRMFRSLMLYENSGVRRLGVIKKGVAAAEAFILARDRMYWSVYYHKTTRGVESLLLSTFERARDLLKGGKNIQAETPLQGVLTEGRLAPEDMLEFDDIMLHSHLRTWMHSDDGILSDLCRRYFERDLFKARTLTGEELTTYTKRKLRVDEELSKIGLDPLYYAKIDYAQVFPYAPTYSEDEGDIGVVDVGKDGNVKGLVEITEQSEVIRLLRGERKEGFRLYSTSRGMEAISTVIDS